MLQSNGRIPGKEMTRALTIMTLATQLIVNGSIHGTHDPLTRLKLALHYLPDESLANYAQVVNRAIALACVIASLEIASRRYYTPTTVTTMTTMINEKRACMYNNFTRAREILPRQSLVASTRPS